MPRKQVGTTPQNKAQHKATKHDDEVVERLGGKDPVVDPTDDVQEKLAGWRDDVDGG